MLYKDILWIDDIDKSDSDVADLEEEENEDNLFVSTDTITESEKEQIISGYFENSFQNIQLIRRMRQAFDEIINNYDKYNLVIFDLNMQKGWNTPNEKGELANEFKNYNIKYTTEDTNQGIYLYLLLLTKGYPANRMIIYTGNSTKTLYENFSYLNLENITKEKDVKLNPEKYYEKGSYYRIRRLVLQACEFWKDWLYNSPKMKDHDDMEENEPKIPFNKLYFPNKEQRISKENFKELLERIEMMFPVIQPASTESVYYQATRILCGYHENNAVIKKLSKYENLYIFHLVCRSFRNWSSHNKFAKAEMPAEIFAIVFCIALRTYFDEKQNNENNENTFDSTLNYYEEIYFTEKDIPGENYKKVCGKIQKKLTEEISLIGFFEKAVYTQKYSHLVHIWGEKNQKANLEDILMPIILKDLDIWPDGINLSNLPLNRLSDLHISQLNDAYQSDGNNFIDLMIYKSIELWSEKSVETI